MVEGSSVSPADPNPDVPLGSVARRDWWKSAVVYQIYPRSFADSDGDGIGDLGGITRPPRLPRARSASTWSGCPRSTRRRRTTTATTSATTSDIDPLFGTLAQLRRAARAAARARHEAGDGPGRQPHLRRAPVVRRVALVAGQPEARLVLVAPAAARHRARDTRGPSRTTGARSSPARPGSSTTSTGEYYLHLFSRKQPDLNWENPEVREAVYAMMRWWLDRGVDGFRMDVINMISKVPTTAALPDGVPAPTACGTAHRTSSTGPRIHEFLQEMHREVVRRPRRAAHRRRDAGRHRGGGARCSPTRRAPRSTWCSSSSTSSSTAARAEVGRARRSTCASSRQSLGRWQAGLAEVGWNSLYWNNHDQPRVRLAGSATTASTACSPRRRSAPCCTCTAARRTSTRAKSSG